MLIKALRINVIGFRLLSLLILRGSSLGIVILSTGLQSLIQWNCSCIQCNTKLKRKRTKKGLAIAWGCIDNKLSRVA